MRHERLDAFAPPRQLFGFVALTRFPATVSRQQQPKRHRASTPRNRRRAARLDILQRMAACHSGLLEVVSESGYRIREAAGGSAGGRAVRVCVGLECRGVRDAMNDAQRLERVRWEGTNLGRGLGTRRFAAQLAGIGFSFQSTCFPESPFFRVRLLWTRSAENFSSWPVLPA
jgi:hypothetical protein